MVDFIVAPNKKEIIDEIVNSTINFAKSWRIKKDEEKVNEFTEKIYDLFHLEYLKELRTNQAKITWNTMKCQWKNSKKN